MARKLRLAIQNLSYCGGCEVALADLGPALLDLLDRQVDLVYSTILTSASDYEDVDVLFLTGAVRTQEEIEHVKKARERARYLVSFGSCASFGGIPGLANLYDSRGLLDDAFMKAVSVDRTKTAIPQTSVPDLISPVKPVAEYVAIDYLLPGCPPLPPMITEFLNKVLPRIRT
jgi:F420-non-reducing hydrogenase small subunit